jgi:hypothetical protein
LEFSNSPFTGGLSGSMTQETQEISRGMGADVAPTSVPKTPLASLIFLNSRERENKALLGSATALDAASRPLCVHANGFIASSRA